VARRKPPHRLRKEMLSGASRTCPRPESPVVVPVEWCVDMPCFYEKNGVCRYAELLPSVFNADKIKKLRCKK